MVCLKLQGLLYFKFLILGGGGLEIRGDGARPDLPLDIHGGLRAWYGVDYPAGAEPLRYHEADRHQVQQDREKEDDADEHGSRGGLVDDSARLRAAFTAAAASPSSPSSWASSSLLLPPRSPASSFPLHALSFSSSSSPSSSSSSSSLLSSSSLSFSGRRPSSKLPIFASTCKRILSRSLLPEMMRPPKEHGQEKVGGNVWQKRGFSKMAWIFPSPNCG